MAQVLPIVDRELRVAARTPRMWVRRVGVVTLTVVVFLVVYLETSRWASPSSLGSNVFSVLMGMAMVYALLTGPQTTADCLARERRDETLGLLFLTNLRAYDIVLGKLAAASLDMLLGLLAVLPLLCVPFLLGGVTLSQAACVGLAVAVLVWLSLSVGLWASSATSSGRAALGITLLVLSLLTLGFPIVFDGIFSLSQSSAAAAFVYMFCPFYLMGLCLDGPSPLPNWQYWLNLGATHGLSWMFLLAACVKTHRAWRGEPVSAPAGRVRRWLARVAQRTRESRAAARSMLERSPMAWLESREVLQTRLLWAAACISVGVWLCGFFFDSPINWLDRDVIILWPFWAHYIFCVWLAIAAPRRLADDKRSGALELLLATPMQPRDMVRGLERSFLRQFGRPFFFLMGFYSVLFVGGIIVHNRFMFTHGVTSMMVSFYICQVVVFPLQAWAIVRVGIYQGLLWGNSLKATFFLVGILGLLPYGLFLALLILIEFGMMRWLRPSFDHVLYFWAGCHLAVLLPMAMRAHRKLASDFRLLAVERPPPPWLRLWQILRGIRRPS